VLFYSFRKKLITQEKLIAQQNNNLNLMLKRAAFLKRNFDKYSMQKVFLTKPLNTYSADIIDVIDIVDAKLLINSKLLKTSATKVDRMIAGLNGMDYPEFRLFS